MNEMNEEKLMNDFMELQTKFFKEIRSILKMSDVLDAFGEDEVKEFIDSQMNQIYDYYKTNVR